MDARQFIAKYKDKAIGFRRDGELKKGVVVHAVDQKDNTINNPWILLADGTSINLNQFEGSWVELFYAVTLEQLDELNKRREMETISQTSGSDNTGLNGL